MEYNDDKFDSWEDMAANGSSFINAVELFKNRTMRLKDSGIIKYILSGVKSKYIQNIRETDYDSYNYDAETGGLFRHKSPEIVYAIFGMKPLKKSSYGYYSMEGYENGTYTKRLDKKTCVIMSVSSHFEIPTYNSSHPVTEKYRMYNIYIIGVNALTWRKRLILRSNRIYCMQNQFKKNINNGKVWVDSHQHFTNAKKLSSIITSRDIIQCITNAIDKFIGNKEIYKSMGIPYRLGILLYGDPGTGKSALIKSLALHYKKSIRYLDRDYIQDYSRNQNWYSITPLYEIDKNFYVIEEIDTLLEKRKGKQKEDVGKESITAFIDDLQNGEIIFATTNYRDKILEKESSIIRPGRFSIHVELKYFDRECAERMVDTFPHIKDRSFLNNLEYPICPAELEFICTQKTFSILQ